MAPRKAKEPRKPAKSATRKPAWKGVSLSDLKDLAQKIKEKFNWKHTPRDFQMDAVKAQLLRKDVIVHAGTGAGKTFIAAGPHAHEAVAGRVTFLISPLIALQEEQVREAKKNLSAIAYNHQVQSFRDEYGLTAIAVNTAHGGCTKEIMADIVTGKWQIVVISPEMILSKRFTKNVLRNPEIRQRVVSVVIDEAHVVSHWGSGFRKKYGALGVLRALLPKETPFIAMSATLPGRVRRDVLKKLQYDENNYTYLNIGNDRPNVSIVVRAIQNPINSFSDLDFIVPKDAKSANDVPKTFIYADNITVGSDIMEHLYMVSGERFREEGIIRTYSAAFSKEYRQNAMKLFKSGRVRVLICTDAAGMGCNIPDIDVVVQWKLPSTLSSFVQRAGRAARGNGRSGLAVLLVEKTAYDVDITTGNIQNKKASKKKGNIREATEHPKSKDKDYALKHGVLRGAYSGDTDTVPERTAVPIDFHSVDEGLYAFVQTLACRRAVLTEVYENEKPNPTVPCCDLCCPNLFDKTRPAPFSTKSRKKARATAGAVDEDLKKEIINWREYTWRRDFGDSLLGPTVIMSNETVESLSSYGPISEEANLKAALGENWVWHHRYGKDLLDLFKRLDIAPKKAKPPKPRASKGGKRPQDKPEENEQSKRQRTENPLNTPNPTPVNVWQTPNPHPTPPQPYPVYPISYPYPLPQTPLSSNPYASLTGVTASSSSSSSPFTTHFPTAFTPIPLRYPSYYPMSSSIPSSAHQTSSWYSGPYPYPPPPPGPPPPPPSTR